MAPIDRCLASMARLGLAQVARPSATSIPRFLAPTLVHGRPASMKPKKAKREKVKLSKDFKRHDIMKKGFPRFSLCEAMRILRAAAVGNPPAVVKYDLHINLKTSRHGAVIKSSIRYPNPVYSDWQIAVICPEGSEAAIKATAAGAVAVGEESIFEAIRQEKITFDKLLCVESSEKALNATGLGRILGPKGLMPSRKTNTIVQDPVKAIKESSGAVAFRERYGVIRVVVGQLGFKPDQLKSNIKALMANIKKVCAEGGDSLMAKEIHDVVLTTTCGPAVSLSGKLNHENDEVSIHDMAGAM